MEMEKEPLPEVELYSIGPDEADYAAPLLTGEAVEEMESAMDGMLTYVTAAFSPQMDGLEQLFTRVGFVIEEESAVTSWQIPLKKLMGSLLFARRVPAPGRCMLRTLEHAQDLDLRQLVEKLAQNGVADLTVSQMR